MNPYREAPAPEPKKHCPERPGEEPCIPDEGGSCYECGAMLVRSTDEKEKHGT